MSTVFDPIGHVTTIAGVPTDNSGKLVSNYYVHTYFNYLQ